MYVTYLYLKDDPIKMDYTHFTWFNSLKYLIYGLSIIKLKWLSNLLPDSILLFIGLGSKISMLLYMSWVLSVPAAFAGQYIRYKIVLLLYKL